MVAVLPDSPGPPPAAPERRRTVSIAVAHQKGGVGKSTSAALLAAEIAWLRLGTTVLVEDHDPDLNLTARWPGDTDRVRLVPPGTGRGHLRILDTGPGNADQLDLLLARVDWVVVPVRLEPMSTQALGVFLPRLRALQDANAGMPRLAGFVLTHYVSRIAEHRTALEDLEAFALDQGARVLGVIPFVAAVGMRLSTRGHHYRDTALRLLEVIGHGRERA
jgi:cellulose biosynthesis protein BcsQ